jgi:AcrR family transcriptional regulator
VATSSRPYRGVSAEARRADRRARLIEAGLELLGERGWAGTTVRAVCAEAELTERYFYESFDNREQLILAVFDRVTSEAAEAVLAAVAAAPHDARAKARAAIEAFVEMLTDDPRRARAILVEPVGSEAGEARRREAIRSFAALVADQASSFYGPAALAPEDAALTAMALVGGLAELLVSWLEGELAVPRERLIDHGTELFVAAAKVSSARRAPG